MKRKTPVLILAVLMLTPTVSFISQTAFALETQYQGMWWDYADGVNGTLAYACLDYFYIEGGLLDNGAIWTRLCVIDSIQEMNTCVEVGIIVFQWDNIWNEHCWGDVCVYMTTWYGGYHQNMQASPLYYVGEVGDWVGIAVAQDLSNPNIWIAYADDGSGWAYFYSKNFGFNFRGDFVTSGIEGHHDTEDGYEWACLAQQSSISYRDFGLLARFHVRISRSWS
jgi:hypothetical protein